MASACTRGDGSFQERSTPPGSEVFTSRAVNTVRTTHIKWIKNVDVSTEILPNRLLTALNTEVAHSLARPRASGWLL